MHAFLPLEETAAFLPGLPNTSSLPLSVLTPYLKWWVEKVILNLSLFFQSLHWPSITLGQMSQILNEIEHPPANTVLPAPRSFCFPVYHTHCLSSGHSNLLYLRTFPLAVSPVWRLLTLPGLLVPHFSALKWIHWGCLPWPQLRVHLPVRYSLRTLCLSFTMSVLVLSPLFLYLFKDCLLEGRATSASVI